MHSHHRFWPRRLPHEITIPATSLWDNLATSARRYPGKAALVFFGRSCSYAELLQKAERLAAQLHALGVQRGDRVLLDMQLRRSRAVHRANDTSTAPRQPEDGCWLSSAKSVATCVRP